MGVNVRVDGLMVLTGAAVAGGVLLYLNRQAVGQAFNPASDQNLAYKGVNAVGSELSGDDNFSFGVWLWEITHAEQVAREKELLQPSVITLDRGIT